MNIFSRQDIKRRVWRKISSRSYGLPNLGDFIMLLALFSFLAYLIIVK